MSKITFRLVRSMSGTYYWTAFLPTQIHHEKEEKIAVKNMANVINNIRLGKFDLERHDLLTDDSGPKNFVGGLRYLLSFADKKRKRRRTIRKEIKRKQKKVKPLPPKGLFNLMHSRNSKSLPVKKNEKDNAGSIRRNLRRKQVGKRKRTRK